MEIEFDPEKARANPIRHEGVTFEEVKPVLLDPYALTREDTDTEGEHRFVSLGMWAARVGFWWRSGRSGGTGFASFQPGRPTNHNGGAMSNNSDPLFDRYATMDFGDAKPVSAVPAWLDCKPSMVGSLA